MKNEKLLKESIESLKLLSLEMHDEMGNSKINERLQETIEKLESYRDAKSVSVSEILKLVGDALRLIPAVAALLDVLSKLD
ncbi:MULTISPECIES: hypothetical protein [Photorhabdus]|uniref:hypothetical protein n=1 Tax=Photorhabdus TaxID=29487 RepID=UPI001561E9B9|nr:MULTISPECIES: hypothetical protein [Photorhabdus]MBS9432222.1 hypothetical protein [Photorhabdus hainanensis]NRN27104.1 hypothetical protein [Photorhabdus heterorhabditis subsp. aluminescens]